MIPALLKSRSTADEVLTASRNLALCRRIGKEIAVFQYLSGVVVGVLIVLQVNVNLLTLLMGNVDVTFTAIA